MNAEGLSSPFASIAKPSDTSKLGRRHALARLLVAVLLLLAHGAVHVQDVPKQSGRGRQRGGRPFIATARTTWSRARRSASPPRAASLSRPTSRRWTCCLWRTAVPQGTAGSRKSPTRTSTPASCPRSVPGDATSLPRARTPTSSTAPAPPPARPTPCRPSASPSQRSRTHRGSTRPCTTTSSSFGRGGTRAVALAPPRRNRSAT
mmetsp:Transcript_23650/g.79897  ORF Transcript_23650/g.79897 Transcript_23650/m.79897 type:complete len:205 (+) Transcript_23650:3-617(+)